MKKWKWVGHNLRKSTESITSATQQHPQAKRKSGARPKNIWRRNLNTELEENNIYKVK